MRQKLVLDKQLGLAFVSLMSNTGFSLVSIEAQSYNAVVRNESADTIIIDREIAQLESDIEFLNNDRVLAQDKKKALPDNWSTKEQDLIIENTTEEIATRNNRINELLLLRQEATNQELILSSKASDIFTLLGQGKYEGSTVMLVLMMLIAVLLECLTIITAGTYPLKSKKDSKEVAKVEPKHEAVEEIEVVTDLPVSTPKVAMTIDKKGILEYLDVMFEDGIAKLKNDIEISKKTGIKLNTCKAYRRQLLSMTYNNKSIIVAKKGKGTHSTMPLRSVKKLIQLEMNVEDK